MPKIENKGDTIIRKTSKIAIGIEKITTRSEQIGTIPSNKLESTLKINKYVIHYVSDAEKIVLKKLDIDYTFKD